MVLYTCPGGKGGAGGPLGKHPCGTAARALDEAGHDYELEKVGGMKMIPFSRRGKRDQIKRLTGQEDVPVLVLDSGETVQGSKAIRDWAAANPAAG